MRRDKTAHFRQDFSKRSDSDDLQCVGICFGNTGDDRLDCPIQMSKCLIVDLKLARCGNLMYLNFQLRHQNGAAEYNRAKCGVFDSYFALIRTRQKLLQRRHQCFELFNLMISSKFREELSRLCCKVDASDGFLLKDLCQMIKDSSFDQSFRFIRAATS